MKKNYVYALCFIAAMGGKLCASAVDMGLVERFERLKAQYGARLTELRSIDGTEDCAAFVAKELRVAEEKSRLYGLDLDRIAGVFDMLLAPRIEEQNYYGYGTPQGPKSLIHFLGGLRRGNELSLSLDNRPDMHDRLRPILTEVTNELARVLPSVITPDGDLNMVFNTVVLTHLCRLGNAACLFTREADEELRVKGILLKNAVMTPGEPPIETKAIAKDFATANSEKRFLARIVEAFEAFERALRAAGRMS